LNFSDLRVLTYYRRSLRERKEDIPALTKHFINMYNHKLGCRVNKVSKEVYDLFFSYNWPGNVRELQHAIEHAANVVTGSVIGLEHLPDHLRRQDRSCFGNKTVNFDPEDKLPDILSKVERSCLVQAMKKCSFNISRAAIYLGIPRQTLQYKLKIYDINQNKVM
jgi:arginine utilization regulatory protein